MKYILIAISLSALTGCAGLAEHDRYMKQLTMEYVKGLGNNPYVGRGAVYSHPTSSTCYAYGSSVHCDHF